MKILSIIMLFCYFCYAEHGFITEQESVLPKKIKTQKNNTNERLNAYIAEEGELKTIKTDDDYTKIILPEYLKKFINDEQCSIIMNKFYYINCYDYNLKGSKFIYYHLKNNLLQQKPNIPVYEYEDDTEVEKKFRTHQSDYFRNEFDMKATPMVSPEHFDNSQQALYSTFLMSNFVPMHNGIIDKRSGWLGIQVFERYLTNRLQDLDVFTIIYYEKKPQFLLSNIAIPVGFGKVFFNEKQNFKKCFLLPNHPSALSEDFKNLEINCDELDFNFNY